MESATNNTENPRIYALVVAAGGGARAGGAVPKQYQKLAGKPMLRYSCEALTTHHMITGVLVVVSPEHHDFYEEAVAGLTVLPHAYGGAVRGESVRAGLNALALYAPDYVLIHDAARPFLPHRVIDGLIEQLTPEQGAVPAIAVMDTVRRLVAGAWEEVSRDGLMRVQTPQAFPYAPLHELTAAPLMDRLPDPFSVTDEAALWLAHGKPLAYATGEEELRKVTVAKDIDWATQHAHGARRTAIGTGFDVHALMPAGDKHMMRIGGIDIDHDHKLHGHSDADVVLHAIVDALLGALGEGDIGAHFSPKDDRWRGADSRLFVEEARRMVEARNGIVQHIDVTVICESPKIGPHRERMRETIAAMLGLPIVRISIKATTTERLGFTGRGEGVAAQAVATVSLPEWA